MGLKRYIIRTFAEFEQSNNQTYYGIETNDLPISEVSLLEQQSDLLWD